MAEYEEKEKRIKTETKIELPTIENNQTEYSLNKEQSPVSNSQEGLAVMNKLIDDMGFSRYHKIIFTITALILICGGVQELMMAIVLSMINEKENLTHYHFAIFTTSEYIGYTTASILVNILTNYLSAKRSIQIFSILTLISTAVSIFTIQFYLAIFSRFLTGICLGMIDILSYLNLIESCPTKIRGFVGSFILLFFPFGQFIISIFCFFQLNSTNDDPELHFRNLLLIPFFAVACTLIVLLPFLQDSARRMIAMKNVMGSVEVIQKISNFNRDEAFLLKGGKIINDLMRRNNEYMENNEISGSYNEKVDKNENLIISGSYLRSPKVADRKRTFKELLSEVLNDKYKRFTIIFWILAAFTGFIFNGIFFMLPTTAPDLKQDTFLEVMTSVSMEIPSNFLVSMMIEKKKVGRLKILKAGYLCTIMVCLICFIAGYDYLIINCLLKFFITIPANVLIVYGAEIYGGKIRTFGVSSINFFKRLATISSPFIVTLLEYSLGPMGPYYIFGPVTLSAFFLSLTLHIETRGVPLEEIELEQV